MKRTNVVKLVLDKGTHEKLITLASATAKCWNEVNWLRMQQFKEGVKVDFNSTEKCVYRKYKNMLKVNASQVARKNAEVWRSFFVLIKEKKESGLPKWFKPRPPGYWRDKLMLVIRNDRYKLDVEKRKIILKDFGLVLEFRGKLKWRGKQGRLEIFYNKARKRWYAYIPMEVEDVPLKQNGLKTSIDLGIANLSTVYVENGQWFLFKGGSVLPQYEYYSKKIAKTQKVLARHGQRRSRLLTLLHEKRRRFLRHALNSMVRKIVSMLDEKGVSEVVVGYPKGIAKRRGNKLTVNFWDYGFIVKRLKEVGEELGIKIVEVEEGYTSRTCSLCGEAHEGGRIFRGLFKCPRTGKAINADLNGAINILHIPESLGTGRRGQLPARDRGNGLKAQPVVYRWMNGAGWLKATSDEVMKMKAVNHKPMIRPKGTLVLQGGKEVRPSSLYDKRKAEELHKKGQKDLRDPVGICGGGVWSEAC